VLWNDNGLAVLTGRTMDWPESTDPVLTVLPRGMARDGGMIGPERVVADNALEWTSTYGSLVTTIYGVGAADGINEKGLAAHLLFLPETDFGARDAAVPGLHAGLWAQYLLDQAATVAEALDLLSQVQIVMAEAQGTRATVHLALEDASGDSAIVEFLEGKMVIHHGPEFQVMTNAPPYDQQLALLAQKDFSKPSSEMPLPGNVNPVDRFQRATYFADKLPKPASQREAVAGMFAIARNVSVPFGAPYKDVGIYNTEYRTVTDSTNRMYFFELTTAPNVIWVDLKGFDLAPGAPVMLLNPDNIDLSGDVTARFVAGAAPY
jgi:penicillin V acylase-like amidase (Ntn superfamily)